jgi:hypothetical protein
LLTGRVDSHGTGTFGATASAETSPFSADRKCVASFIRPFPGQFQSPSANFSPGSSFRVFYALISIYFIGAEQGAFAFLFGSFVHEFVHVGRHLLAFHCH